MVTELMLNVWPPRPGQTVVEPLIEPGVAGAAITVTGKVLARLVPQLFPAVTLMFPFCPVFPVVTVTVADP